MKKFFILCLMAFVMCSCGTIQTYTETYYGSVTTFTPQGEVLQTWDNVVIKEKTTEYNSLYGTTSVTETSAFKNFGLNFIDMNTGKGVIIHPTIPYIVEYNTEIERPNTKTDKDIKRHNAEQLEEKHRNLRKQIDTNKQEMKSLERDSAEYQNKKEQINVLREEMRGIEQEYISLTGQYMYHYPF